MNEEFVPYELAVKLKEKGFKKECLCHYIGNDLVYNIESPIANNQLWFCHNKYDNIWHRDNYDAPTISQVLEWLREQKEIYIVIQPFPTMATKNKICWSWDFKWNSDGAYLEHTFPDNVTYATYEKAAIAGIEYVLDNIL